MRPAAYLCSIKNRKTMTQEEANIRAAIGQRKVADAIPKRTFETYALRTIAASLMRIDDAREAERDERIRFLYEKIEQAHGLPAHSLANEHIRMADDDAYFVKNQHYVILCYLLTTLIQRS